MKGVQQGDMSTTHACGEPCSSGVCSWKSRARRRFCLTGLRMRLMKGVLPDMGTSATPSTTSLWGASQRLASSVVRKASVMRSVERLRWVDRTSFYGEMYCFRVVSEQVVDLLYAYYSRWVGGVTTWRLSGKD